MSRSRTAALIAALLIAALLIAAPIGAQNYNNGEDFARLVTSEAFRTMPEAELKPLQARALAHIDRCTKATVADLRQAPKAGGISAAQLDRHYALWKPYYRSACAIFAAEQGGSGAEQRAVQLRCEVFSLSTFYSDVLGYQARPLKACVSE